MSSYAADRTRPEPGAVLRRAVRAVAGRLPDVVTGLAVLVTVLAGLALAGAALDDAAIDRNPALAEAEVLDGSTFARTLVRFTVANGEVVVPERGVFYPRGLPSATTVAVEYDVTHPETVRVAGRSAFGGAVPVLVGVLGGWAVLGPLALWLRRRRHGDELRGADEQCES